MEDNQPPKKVISLLEFRIKRLEAVKEILNCTIDIVDTNLNYIIMKFYIFIISLVFITSCKAQNITTMEAPNITSAPEKFDKSVFTNKKSERIQGKDTVYIYSDDFSYFEHDKNHRILKHFSSSSNSKGEVDGYDYSVNSIFGIYKAFYSNGIIKEKGLFCWFGFKMGIWYYLDEAGTLVNSVDYDSGYDFGVELIFDFCTKNNIPLIRDDNSYSTRISKAEKDGQKIWFIEYPFYKNGTIKFIELDGKTGQVIREFEREFPQGG